MYNALRAPFIFNGRDLSKYLVIQNITREVVPKRKLQITDAGVRTFAKPCGFEPMTIKVTCALMCLSVGEVSDARAMLAAALYTQKPARLILADDNSRYLYALYTGGATPSTLVQYPEVELEFLVNDPIAYGAHHKKRFAKKQRVYTGGTYSTRPIIRVVPPQGTTYWEVRNYTTGRYIGVKRNFDGVSELVIDMQLERATLNKHDTAVDLYSDFFSMSTGDVLTATTEYTIEWEERFI